MAFDKNRMRLLRRQGVSVLVWEREKYFLG